MKNRIAMRMLSILLCFIMLVGLMPTTVLAAEKNKISEFEATATLPDKLYVGMNLYDPNLLETISFNITKGSPAKLDANSPWMYYNEQAGYYERIYKNDDEQIVKAGVRYASLGVPRKAYFHGCIPRDTADLPEEKAEYQGLA